MKHAGDVALEALASVGEIRDVEANQGRWQPAEGLQ
jgi:hypothetical protein